MFALSFATTTVCVDTMKFGQPNINKKHHFKKFALSVATAIVSVDKGIFMYEFKTFISSVFTLSVANATVSVDTMEFGQPIKNHHFNMFALSFATATVSADTILFCA